MITNSPKMADGEERQPLLTSGTQPSTGVSNQPNYVPYTHTLAGKRVNNII